MKILITGAAGFIGFHLAKRLITEGYQIVGLDNINDYYDVNLKYARLKELDICVSKIKYGKVLQSNNQKYEFIKLNLEDKDKFPCCLKIKFDIVINLAAQAGVRYSIKNPSAYMNSNLWALWIF